jgi:hypothetical protein
MLARLGLSRLSSRCIHVPRSCVFTVIAKLQVSGDILNSAKFASCITRELADGLAENVSIDLNKFLLYV